MEIPPPGVEENLTVARFTPGLESFHLQDPNNFVYVKNVSSGNVILWKCTKFRAPNLCPAVAITTKPDDEGNSFITSYSTNHNHIPDIAKIQAAKIWYNIKKLL